MHTVWILGAGFSQSLGGPLLADLLSPESRGKLKSRFSAGEELRTAECDLARHLYLAGTKDKDRREQGGERHWQDVEEYLDVLDAAARQMQRPTTGADASSPHWIEQVIKRVFGYKMQGQGTPPTLGQVRNGARRLLAAECAAFTLNADLNTERWAPYVEWLRGLDHDHTIITFNYDRVIERILEEESLPVHVVLPRGTTDTASREHTLDLKQTNLLKLHGSVDWRRVEGAPGHVAFERTGNASFCVRCPDGEIAIATPGPSKREATGEFESLWKFALNRIGKAERMVFVGYRFPPTDSEARNKLLAAIGGKGWVKGDIHTVLGPNVHSETSERLAGLIKAVTSDAPEQHPMYAEDFLGLAGALLKG